MKKLIALFLCFSILCLCGCTATTEKNNKLIAVSFYPVYIFTLNLTDGIDDVTVQCIAEQNTGCLHDYTVTAKDAKLLSDCDAFVINGAGMEGFVEDLCGTVEDLFVIDSSIGVNVLCQDEEHNEEHHEEHHNHDHTQNSHIWMSVENAIKQVENISTGLINAMPEYEKEINENKQAYLVRLNQLAKEVKDVALSLDGKNVVAFHDAYEYLAKDLSFNIFTTVESDEGAEPSAKEIAVLADGIKENKITALLVEPHYEGSAADILKNETGVQIYIINPVTSGEKEKTAYEDIMRKNIEVLKAVK